MELDDVLRVLRDLAPALAADFGVAHISVFGSVSRGEAVAESDVDVLVEFEPDRPYGYFLLFRLQKRLQEALGAAVDVVTIDGLRAELRDEVLREAVRAA